MLFVRGFVCPFRAVGLSAAKSAIKERLAGESGALSMTSPSRRLRGSWNGP